MATVTIKDLKIKALIGIEPYELKRSQLIILNISFEYDARHAARSESIKDAVDYKELEGQVQELLKHKRFKLAETLAQEVLMKVLADRRVTSATVTVTKPRALRSAAGVSVTMSSP